MTCVFPINITVYSFCLCVTVALLHILLSSYPCLPALPMLWQHSDSFSFVSLFLYRLLRHQLHWRLLTEPLWTRVDLYQEAELLSWLHLWLSQQLLRPLLREKVHFSTFILNCVCVDSCSSWTKQMMCIPSGLTCHVREVGGVIRPVVPVTVRQIRALTLTATRPAESVAVRWVCWSAALSHHCVTIKGMWRCMRFELDI